MEVSYIFKTVSCNFNTTDSVMKIMKLIFSLIFIPSVYMLDAASIRILGPGCKNA